MSVSASLSYFRDMFGPMSFGLSVTHTRETYAEKSKQTGGELDLGLGRDGEGPYLVAGFGLNMGHTDGNVAAQWSAGAGYALRLFGPVSLGIDARYRAEDGEMRGFWRLQPEDRRGLQLLGRLAIGFGGAKSPQQAQQTRADPEFYEPPSESELESASGAGEGSSSSAALRVAVVQTALDAMGTPYRWGGSDGNGFDCSGLIQFAYSEHGLILPRMSQDQARTGIHVDRNLQSLLPGDILGFSGGGGGVTHVGLYVGDGQFIHSASDGVILSSLTAGDTEARWWSQNWITARRVIN